MNDFILSLLLSGALSTGGQLPFWMTTNQFGLMPESNGALAIIGAHTQYDTSKDFQWCWGASLAANYDSSPFIPAESAKINLMVDELYASIRWKYFSLDAGMKHDPIDFYASSPTLGSLSTTSGHIISTNNARTMPGYMFNITALPIPFTRKHVWINAGYGDFVTLDNRYVKNALVHRSKLSLTINITKRLDFMLGLDHYAIWGGVSPDYGPLEISFKNYIRMVTGRRSSTSALINDQIYVIGDQGGGEFFRFDYRGNGWKATFLHDIPYNDDTGMIFQNFPDGVNTLWFSFDDKNRWVSDISYEFIYTRNQSGWYHARPTTEEERAHLDPNDEYYYWWHVHGGGDNYFNNEDYMSGWTYFGRAIGLPLLSPEGTHNGTWTSHRTILGFEYNRIRAHHLGLSGKFFRSFPYKLMLTYSQNYGLYAHPYLGESPWMKEPGTVEEFPLHQFSGALVGEVPFTGFKRITSNSVLRFFTITYGLYADWGELFPTNRFGATLGLRFAMSR